MGLKPLLKGKRLCLTALHKEDAATLAEWHQDADFMRLLDARPAHPKTVASFIKWMENQQAETDGYLFAVRRQENDALIGYLQLDGILWNHQTAWLTVAIGSRADWGQGYGSEATRLVLDFAFYELNLHRVQASVFRYNRRSMVMLEKLGFQREGIFREFLNRGGERHDMILYGLLQSEWEC